MTPPSETRPNLLAFAGGCALGLAVIAVGAAIFLLAPSFFRSSVPTPPAIALATAMATRLVTPSSVAAPASAATRTSVVTTLPTNTVVRTPLPILASPVPNGTVDPNAPIPTATPLAPTEVIPTAVAPTGGATLVVPASVGPTVAAGTVRRVGNGPDAVAPYMAVNQFALDGQLSEWTGPGVPLAFAHYGVQNWSGPQDLSGTAWFGWNENGLMLAARVVDDQHVQTQRSWEMFRGDSVELWIDADLAGDFNDANGSADDWQLGLSPGDFANVEPEGVVYIPVRDANLNAQILVSASSAADGYTIEAFVPWSVVRVRPGRGLVLGYAVDLSDNDVPNTALQQTQVSEDPNLQFRVPTTFGNLELQ